MTDDHTQVQLRAMAGGVLSPSLGMVRMGIWVMEPFLPSTLPARS